MAENNLGAIIKDIAEAYTFLTRADPTNFLLELATINDSSVLVLDGSFGRTYRQKDLPTRLRAYTEDLRTATTPMEPRTI